jgi:hypothetical protein
VRHIYLFCGAFLITSIGNAGFGQSSCAENGGQLPAPPAMAERMALPACGFAATESSDPNGCQLCDPGNEYPNPFDRHAIPKSQFSRPERP